MRSIYIDLGSNDGRTSLDYASAHPRAEIYCFEPNEKLIVETMRLAIAHRKLFRTHWAAAWTYDGMIDFFQSGEHVASTTVSGKVEYGIWPQIDYASPTAVPCIDFSRWLLDTFSVRDDIFLKMDVEGSEYDLLEKMIADNSIKLIRHLRCEWHIDRYPGIPRKRHDDLRATLGTILPVEDWV